MNPSKIEHLWRWWPPICNSGQLCGAWSD